MAAGIRVWDASGNLILDSTSTNVGRVIGSVSWGSNNGSVTDPGFANGTPFWFFVNTTSGGAGNYQPTASFNSSTNTLSWSWPSPSGSTVYGILVYGFYT